MANTTTFSFPTGSPPTTNGIINNYHTNMSSTYIGGYGGGGTSSINNTTAGTTSIRTGRMHLDEGKISIGTNGSGTYNVKEINLLDVLENLDEINKVLRILNPDKNLLASDVTLQDAYREYQEAKEEWPPYSSDRFKNAYDTYVTLESLIKASNK